MEPSEVTTQIVVEVATDFVVPRSCQLNTLVLNLTTVDLRLRAYADVVREVQDLRVDQVEGALVEIVKACREAVVECSDVNANTPLLRSFPCQSGIECTVIVNLCAPYGSTTQTILCTLVLVVIG